MLKRNIAANFVGQIYAAGISIVMLPVYVRHLGAEAYGLVGFLTMLQAWCQLIDLGLTPTLSRELSRFKAGILPGSEVATMVRSTEWLMGGVGAACAGTVALAAGWIARDWLKAQQLPQDEIIRCLIMMGGILATRWLVGLYRGGLAGLEQMVPLNLAGIVLATLRAVGVMAVLLFWTTRPAGFFAYQLVVALVELVVMKMLFYRAFPMRGAGWHPVMRSLRGVLGLATTMALLTGLWVVISQTDKLVLSWTLDLPSYGFYMVVVALAGGISLLAGPLSQALQPRFTVLASRGDHASLVRLYRASTQATCAGVFAVAGVMACFAAPLLQAWTNNLAAVRSSAGILPLYALGNAVSALLVLAFLIQFAYGRLRWHVIGNCVFALIWLPGVWLAAQRAGAVGVGWIWLLGNVVYLVGWVPVVHHHLLPGLGWRWLVWDVGVILLAEAGMLALIAQMDLATLGRPGVFAALALVTAGVALVGLLAGGESRPALLRLTRSLLVAKSA